MRGRIREIEAAGARPAVQILSNDQGNIKVDDGSSRHVDYAIDMLVAAIQPRLNEDRSHVRSVPAELLSRNWDEALPVPDDGALLVGETATGYRMDVLKGLLHE